MPCAPKLMALEPTTQGLSPILHPTKSPMTANGLQDQYHPNGSMEGYKALLIAKKYNQQEVLAFFETHPSCQVSHYLCLPCPSHKHTIGTFTSQMSKMTFCTTILMRMSICTFLLVLNKSGR